jgi:hypothetical protein
MTTNKVGKSWTKHWSDQEGSAYGSASDFTSPAQAKEIFARMMQDDVYVTDVTISQADTPEAQMLAQLAGEFAKNIPGNTFSPADLQDYLADAQDRA